MATKKATETLGVRKGSQKPEIKTNQKELIAEFKKQIKEIQAKAKAQGISIPVIPVIEVDINTQLKKRVKPTLANGGREWTMKDLAKEGLVDLIPSDLPNAPVNHLMYDFGDGISRKSYTFTVNGVSLTLVVGVLNRVPKAFYHAYKDLEKGLIANDKFRKHGPEWGPHSEGGPSGNNTWFYQEGTPSAWFDIDGRYLNPDETYIMYLGVPIPLGKDLPLYKGSELARGDWKAPTVQEHRERIREEAKNPEPEPEWHKTLLTGPDETTVITQQTVKRRTNGTKNQSPKTSGDKSGTEATARIGSTKSS